MTARIHQELHFAATPERLYEAFMDSRQHGAFTGGPANIARDAGGLFTCHDGRIEGRNIELLANKRIVQAWRAANWPDGVYSIVKLEFESVGDETKVTLDHAGYPDGAGEQLDAGWRKMYWDPLRAYLAS